MSSAVAHDGSRVRRALVLALRVTCVALAASCGSGSEPAGPATHLASVSCPLKTPADWQRFLETTANDERWVKTCSDLDNCHDVLGAFVQHVQIDVLGVLARCTSDVAGNPPIASCTANLRRYVPAWMQQHSSDSYGFRQDNASYFAAQTGPDEPAGMMALPVELLSAFPDRAQIEATARTRGWPYLTHDSCLGGVRIFLMVGDPDDRFDQWMLVGLDAESKRVISPAIVSFIGVQIKDDQGERLARVRLHFRDYWVDGADGSWKLTLPETLSGKCYACHGSGMRLLNPARGSVADSAPVKGEEGYGQGDPVPDFGLARLVSLNQRLTSYGLPDWNGTVEPADHGPPLGRELGCTGCHDGASRGVLTVSTSEGMLGQKIVVQLSMRSTRNGQSVPDQAAMALLERDQTANPPLSPTEKIELERARIDHGSDYQSIVAERFPAWRTWLLDRRCQ
jgi:hypothetical protein